MNVYYSRLMQAFLDDAGTERSIHEFTSLAIRLSAAEPDSELARVFRSVGISASSLEDWNFRWKSNTENSAIVSSKAVFERLQRIRTSYRLTSGGTAALAILLLDPDLLDGPGWPSLELKGRFGYSTHDLVVAAVAVDRSSKLRLAARRLPLRADPDHKQLDLTGATPRELVLRPNSYMSLVLERADVLRRSGGSSRITSGALLQAAAAHGGSVDVNNFFDGLGIHSSHLARHSLRQDELEAGASTVVIDNSTYAVSGLVALALQRAETGAEASASVVGFSTLLLAALSVGGTDVSNLLVQAVGAHLNRPLLALLTLRPIGVSPAEAEYFIALGDGPDESQPFLQRDVSDVDSSRWLLTLRTSNRKRRYPLSWRILSRVIRSLDESESRYSKTYQSVKQLVGQRTVSLSPTVLHEGLVQAGVLPGQTSRIAHDELEYCLWNLAISIDEGESVNVEQFIQLAGLYSVDPADERGHDVLSTTYRGLDRLCEAQAERDDDSRLEAKPSIGMIIDLSAYVHRLLQNKRDRQQSARYLGGIIRLKYQLCSASATSQRGLEWARTIGGDLADFAKLAAFHELWTESAVALIADSRIQFKVDAFSSSDPSLSKAELVPLVEFDVRNVDQPTLLLFLDGEAVLVVYSHGDGDWQGIARRGNYSQWLSEWWETLAPTLDSGAGPSIDAELRRLGDLLGLAEVVPHLAGHCESRSKVLSLVIHQSAGAVPLIQMVNLLGEFKTTWAVAHLGGGLTSRQEEPLHLQFPHDGGAAIFGSPLGGGVQGLPFGELEAHSAAKILQAEALFTGHKANKSTFSRLSDIRANAGGYPVWHFSCHGTLTTLPDGERTAAIVLTDRELLSAADMTRRSRGELIVCSACSISMVPSSAGASSWPYSALTGGCRGVIAAPWPVDDLLTAAFMVKFYTLWKASPSAPGRALAEADAWLVRATIDDLVAELAGQLSLPDSARAKMRNAVVARNCSLGFGMYMI